MSFLQGKVGLVTGGASGLGFSIVGELLKNNVKAVSIVDINEERGENVLQMLTEGFGPNKIIFIKTDVSVQSEVEAAFKKTVETFEQLDIVVNSAGIFNDKEWETSVAVNLNGTLRTCLLAAENYLPRYKCGPEAVIVNISSICGLHAFGGLPIYVATKFGVLGFSKSFSAHYERTKVRVLTLCPGITDTPLLTKVEPRFFSSAFEALSKKDLFLRPGQKPEVVAESLVKIICDGDNGSVWVVENESTYQVNFTDLLQNF